MRRSGRISPGLASTTGGFRYVFKVTVSARTTQPRYYVRVTHFCKEHGVSGTFSTPKLTAEAADTKAVELGQRKDDLNFPGNYERLKLLLTNSTVEAAAGAKWRQKTLTALRSKKRRMLAGVLLRPLLRPSSQSPTFWLATWPAKPARRT